MKSRKIVFLSFAGFTLIIVGYFLFCVYYIMPDTYTLIEGSSLNFRLPPGITASYDMPASVGGRLEGGVTEGAESRTVSVKVLGFIPAGKVSVNTVKAPVLYPSGECIGLKMYSDGLIVSGFTDFETEDGICVSPGAKSGLKTGDVITKINGTRTSSVKEFTKIDLYKYKVSRGRYYLYNIKELKKTISIKYKIRYNHTILYLISMLSYISSNMSRSTPEI